MVFSCQPILMNAISIPLTAYIIRRLGPTNYGEWTAATSLIGVAGSFATLGLRGHYVRAVASEPARAATLTAEQMGLRLGLGTAVTLGSVLVAWALHYPQAVIACTLIAGVGLIVNSISTTATDLFQARGELMVIASIAMAYGILVSLATTLAVWGGVGSVGLALAYLTGPITWAILSIRMMQVQDVTPRVHWNLARFWAHLVDARYLAAQQFVGALGQNAEGIAAPALVGMSRYGLFAAGTLIPSRLAAIPDGISSAMYPTVAARWEGDPVAATRAISEAVTLTLALCLPLCLLSCFVATPISQILFPGEPETCALIIRITSWSLPLLGINMIVGYALIAAGLDVSQLRVVLIASILAFGASIGLIWAYGLLGVCASYLLRQVIFILCRQADYRAAFGGLFTRVPIGRISVCNGFLLFALWLLHPIIWPNASNVGVVQSVGDLVSTFGRLGLEGTAAVIFYALVAIPLRLFGESDLLGRLWRKLRRSVG